MTQAFTPTLTFTLRLASLNAIAEREEVRADHAAWSEATFGPTGTIGPVGPLKHLSKEALEAAEKPSDVMEFADCQLLLWDAQRRAGHSDEMLNSALRAAMAKNKARDWPAPKDGEAREHVRTEPSMQTRMASMLLECSVQFRFYQSQHEAKGTPDGTAKALVNREMAEKIEALLLEAVG